MLMHSIRCDPSTYYVLVLYHDMTSLIFIRNGDSNTSIMLRNLDSNQDNILQRDASYH